MNSVETYAHRIRTGTVFAVLTMLLIFPVMCANGLIANRYGSLPGIVALVTVLVVAAAFYAFYVTEAAVTLDEHTVRFTQQDIAFGVRRARRVIWELPRAELDRAHEVTTRTPGNRGGWVHSTVLHLPGDRQVSDGQLGPKDDPTSAYHRLTQSLRAQLGERFTHEEKV